jgi:hypothetical protein
MLSKIEPVEPIYERGYILRIPVFSEQKFYIQDVGFQKKGKPLKTCR